MAIAYLMWYLTHVHFRLYGLHKQGYSPDRKTLPKLEEGCMEEMKSTLNKFTVAIVYHLTDTEFYVSTNKRHIFSLGSKESHLICKFADHVLFPIFTF